MWYLPGCVRSVKGSSDLCTTDTHTCVCVHIYIYFFFTLIKKEGGWKRMEERGKRKRGREDKKKKADLNPEGMNNY